VWGKKGKRQRIVKDIGFEYAYIYGAICPERDVGEAIVIDCVGKEAMQKHLQAISDRIAIGHHGVVLMDKAPWHQSLILPYNMTIIHLPSYSPELNPQENIWEYLKNNYLSNKVFKDLKEIINTCCDAWNALCSEKNRISSIGNREWATLPENY
jgi:transposase